MLQYSIQTVVFMRSLHSSFTSTGMIIFLGLYTILRQYVLNTVVDGMRSQAVS